MKVLFQNHASLLIEHCGQYLLTDPWFIQPAFGSWLPTFPSYVHPAYLAALGEKLTILVSHGHDDHFDDQLLTLFDAQTRFVTADYQAPSVRNRLKRLGFEVIETVGQTEIQIGDWLLSAFINPQISEDDALFLIRTHDGAVIHANDNWFPLSDANLQLIADRTADYSRQSVLLFSQTNSASGYPLTYDIYSESEKIRLLQQKIIKMVTGGLENARRLKLPRMFSYAGYATPYVKGQPYHQQSVFSTAGYLNQLLAESAAPADIYIEDFQPGDWIALPSGQVQKAFVCGYTDQKLKEKADLFYRTYGMVEQCISYRSAAPGAFQAGWTDDFLLSFHDFACSKATAEHSNYASVLGKRFRLTVFHGGELSYCRTVQFGQGFCNDAELEAHKECLVDSAVFQQVLNGTALFEDLYTGYNARWRRTPATYYNRDLVMMIVMFSYLYKNRLANALIAKYHQA